MSRRDTGAGRDVHAPIVQRMRENVRPHASIPERRVDMWEALHATFVREAKEAGTAGRPRCRTLFLGDSITEAMRGTQFGEHYDELSARRTTFEAWFPLHEARAFGISGDRTQNLLYRLCNGELSFRHPPGVVVLCIGTNNLGRDQDSAADTFLGIRAVVLEILQRLPGTRVLLTGILPRGPALGMLPNMPPAPGETSGYTTQVGTRLDGTTGAGEPGRPDAAGVTDGFARKYSQPGVHTEAIEHVNRRLEALARGSGGAVAYVECKHAFVSPDGAAIRPELMRDVLHPSAEGMNAWFAVLKPAVEALRAAPAPRDSWYSGAHVMPSSENGSLETIEPGVRLALSRLIAWSPHALCVCDTREKGADNPIVFANDNFFVQTGYSPEEVIGKNCRFLQGPGTDPETVKQMSRCIAAGEEFSGRVLNYHKNGTVLVNSLVMSPLRGATGTVTHYIGIQRLAESQALKDAPAEYQFRAAM